MVKRDNKGKFIYTTGEGRYKRKEVNGKNEMLSRLIWEQHYGEIPKGMIIHHIDKNKLNNDISNLAMMSYAAHNKLHACDRPIWNKGMTTKTNEKWRKICLKAQEGRNKKSIERWKKMYELRKQGMTYFEIGKELNICRETASYGVRKYKKIIKQNDQRRT